MEQPQLRGELPAWDSFLTGRTHHCVSFINSKTPSQVMSVKIHGNRIISLPNSSGRFNIRTVFDWLEHLLTCELFNQSWQLFKE